MPLALIIASVGLLVYSPKSSNPLHVAATDPATGEVTMSWEFPASYTGHRTVCSLPGADSSMLFAAWAGGAEYDPVTDPFGVSTGYDYPMVGVTHTSPITPRFDVFKTGFMEVATTNIRPSSATFTESVRVRVVRWKIDDVPIYAIAVEPRVVFDKVMDPYSATTITEGDFIDEDTFDLDWDNFYSGVVQNPAVRGGNFRVVKADYLAIIGYGDVSWYSFESNKWLTASKQVITRRFREVRETATGLSCSVVDSKRLEFAWSVDVSDPATVPTAFRIKVFEAATLGTSATNVVADSGDCRLPPANTLGVCRWAAPTNWVSSITNGAVWGVQLLDSKFRYCDERRWQTVSFGSEAQEPSKAEWLPVYSPKSASPLHVAAMETNTMSVAKSWEFPASYTGHRSVCFLPDADSSMTFAAWAGGAEYNPATDPFGVSTGYDYPMVGVTHTSPITPRFDVFKTGFMEVATTNIRPSSATFTEPVRVRVVQWKVDGYPMWDLAMGEPSVIFDKVMNPRVAATITENDFIDEDTFDLDWDDFYSKVVRSAGAIYGNLPIVKADYLAIIGEGDVSWFSYETNKWRTASKQVITRYYATNRVDASAMSISTNTPDASAVFSWRINDFPRRGTTDYTAFRIVANGADAERDSDIRRMPPRDPSGVYRWAAPHSWTNITSWGISIFNSKFRTTNTVWSVVQ